MNRSLSLRHLETLQECWSRPLIGWIIQDFRETCVAFFNVPPGNKDVVAPNSLTKEESRRVYNRDAERLSGSTKRWGYKSMWNISSLKYIREFHTPVCYYGNISTNPKRDAERNELWLVVWHVSYGRTLTNETLPSIPDLQPLRETKWIETKNSRDAPIWTLWPIPIILYIWKPITDMLADKSISKFLYTFWEPD